MKSVKKAMSHWSDNKYSHTNWQFNKGRTSIIPQENLDRSDLRIRVSQPQLKLGSQ